MYVEWAERVNQRQGLMVPLDTIGKLVNQLHSPGFRSYFMFDEAAALTIKNEGYSRNFNRFTLYSDQLFIDLDDGATGVPRVEEYIRDNGLKAELWSSGGKGFHFHIATPLHSGNLIHIDHKALVKTLGIAFDPTLYQPGRLFRLPNTVHQKTKQRKRLIREYVGNLLTIPEVDKTAMQLTFKAPVETLSRPVDALLRVASAMYQDPSPGTRHQLMWGATTTMHKAGFSPELAYALLEQVNRGWSVPKSDDEIRVIIGRVYGS